MDLNEIRSRLVSRRAEIQYTLDRINRKIRDRPNDKRYNGWINRKIELDLYLIVIDSGEMERAILAQHKDPNNTTIDIPTGGFGMEGLQP